MLFIHLCGIIISFTGIILSYVSLHPRLLRKRKKHNNLLACYTYVKHFSYYFHLSYLSTFSVFID